MSGRVRAPDVTFVIATYRRADALRCTLRSLVLQQHPDWLALVIGDACGEETEAAVRAVGDPRIRYYNLPTRFGEQSGPNSFGLHLAASPWLAFLNHDDLLLADHLSRALPGAAVHGADVYVARSAEATLLEEDGDALRPVFTQIRPLANELGRLLAEDPYVLDPSSFWVVRTAFAKRVGRWRPARTLWRTPLRDWVLRASRLGARFAVGDVPTGLRFWTQNLRASRPLYESRTPEHQAMLARMERETPDALRAEILAEVARRGAPEPGSPGWRPRLAGRLHRATGIDVHVVLSRLAGRPPGAVLQTITAKRTGAELPPVPALEPLLADPEAHRVV